jgi:hypothetical protein
VPGESVTLLTTGGVFDTVTLALTGAPASVPSVGVTVHTATSPAENGPASVLALPDATPSTVQAYV